MRGNLHVGDIGSWPAGDGLPKVHDLPPVKLRPPWLIFLARHFAPRNHERYLLQGVELSEETLARIRAMPRKRPVVARLPPQAVPQGLPRGRGLMRMDMPAAGRQRYPPYRPSTAPAHMQGGLSNVHATAVDDSRFRKGI
jgi:hypothetical protein